LLHGIAQGWDWRKTGQLASLMGSLKIAQRGGQNHKPKLADIATAYSAAFGATL
jgi:adenosine kinase